MKMLALNRLSTVGLVIGICSSIVWVPNILALPLHAQSTPNRRELVNVDCVRSDDIASGVAEVDAINCQLQRETELPLIVSTTPVPQALPDIDSDTDPSERDLQNRDENTANEQNFIINVVDVDDSLGFSEQRLISKGDNRFDLLAGRRVIVTIETQSFIPEARFIGPLGQNRRALSLSFQEQRPGVYQTIVTPDEDGEYRVRVLSRDDNGQLGEQSGGYTLSLQYE